MVYSTENLCLDHKITTREATITTKKNGGMVRMVKLIVPLGDTRIAAIETIRIPTVKTAISCIYLPVGFISKNKSTMADYVLLAAVRAMPRD